MKQFNLIVFFLIALCALVGCRSQRSAVTLPTQEIPAALPRTVDRIIEVPVPGDSLLLHALIECDSNNRAILKMFNEQKSSGLESSLSFNDKGELDYKANRPSETTPVSVKDSIIYVPVKGDTIHDITNELTWWQGLWIRLGKIFTAVIGGYIIFRIIKAKFKL